MEEQQDMNDWRSDISEPKATLKVNPDQEVIFTFQDEGTRKESNDYGTSIVFAVKVDNEEEIKLWYVNTRNYDLLGQIKSLGNLTGLKAKVKRVGSRKSDTRYTISKI